MSDPDKSPVPRIVSADKRTSVSVIVIFVVMLIIFPLLISVGKRSSKQQDTNSNYNRSSSGLKFD